MITETREVPPEGRKALNVEMCEPNPFSRASSTMLSRLAEAVDGARFGAAVCYVGRYWYRPGDQGHRLFGPFHDCKEAADYRTECELDPSDYGIFGPFYTRAPNGMGAPLPPERNTVTKVVVHFKDGLGNEGMKEFDGKKTDALFWSASAVEKFVLPYYLSIGSVAECTEVAKHAEAADFMEHRPGSTWAVEPGDTKGLLEEISSDPMAHAVGLYGYSLSARPPHGTISGMLANPALDP